MAETADPRLRRSARIRLGDMVTPAGATGTASTSDLHFSGHPGVSINVREYNTNG